MKKDSEFSFPFLWQEHCHRKIPGAWLRVYVSITVLFWQKFTVHFQPTFTLTFTFQSMNSNTKVGCERCSRLIKKKLVRQTSIVVVHFVRFEQLYTLFKCFYNRFWKASKCPVWCSMPISSHIHNAANRTIAKNSW